MTAVVTNIEGLKAVAKLQIDTRFLINSGTSLFEYNGQSSDPYYQNLVNLVSTQIANVYNDLREIQEQIKHINSTNSNE